MAFFSFLLLVQPSQAETSDDFNELDLFFYGDLDNGNGDSWADMNLLELSEAVPIL